MSDRSPVDDDREGLASHEQDFEQIVADALDSVALRLHTSLLERLDCCSARLATMEAELDGLIEAGATESE